MIAPLQAVEGIFVGHLCLLLFFFLGAAALPWSEEQPSDDAAPRVMLKVLATTALGGAVAGLAIFFLALAGLLRAPFVAAAFVAIAAAACVAWRSSPLRAEYWRSRLLALRRCWDLPLLLLYVLMLLVGLRAIFPELGSDPVSYHLAYAQDWVNAGRLVIDPFLRLPFYASNFVLLLSGMLLFRADAFLDFLPWSFALLGVLGVYALACDAGPDDGGNPRARSAIGFLLALAVVVAPLFQRYADSAFIDVAIGSTALLAVVAIRVAQRTNEWKWLIAAAAIAGFLVGMKGSHLLLLPVYAIALFWAARDLRLTAAKSAAVLAVLCVVGAPWYLRNLVMAGDPVAPALNLSLHGTDGLIRPAEWQANMIDLRGDEPKTAGGFALLPLRAYWRPEQPEFREYGATLLIVLLYVPTLAALGAIFLARRLPQRLAIPIFVLSGLLLYWFASSTLLRYALLFYPLFAACIAMLLDACVARWPRLAWPAIAVAALCLLPSPARDIDDPAHPAAFVTFYRDVAAHYEALALRGTSTGDFLTTHGDGYRDDMAASEWMRANAPGGRLYVIPLHGASLNYYFRRDGVTSMGDWGGPAGYYRLFQAIDRGRAAEFLDDLGADAVLMSPNVLLDAAAERLLVEQLEAGGYREIAIPGNTARLFARKERA